MAKRYATHEDFPQIPPGEIWLDKNLSPVDRSAVIDELQARGLLPPDQRMCFQAEEPTRDRAERKALIQAAAESIAAGLTAGLVALLEAMDDGPPVVHVNVTAPSVNIPEPKPQKITVELKPTPMVRTATLSDGREVRVIERPA